MWLTIYESACTPSQRFDRVSIQTLYCIHDAKHKPEIEQTAQKLRAGITRSLHLYIVHICMRMQVRGGQGGLLHGEARGMYL